MEQFYDTNVYQDGCDPNFIYRYPVGYGPNAVKIWYSAKLKFGKRATIEYDKIRGEIFIRSCNKNVLKEIVESL